jgi:DNA-directed RNA polymerase delta subunit
LAEYTKEQNFDMKISEIAHELKELTKQAQINYSNEVEDIIKYRVKDKHRIEALLDLILDFCFDKEVIIIYKKLVKYYFTIDVVAAIYYINAYRELYDK